MANSEIIGAGQDTARRAPKINTITCGDCLIVSELIPSGSVDLILTDLPYGTVGESMHDNTGKYKRINQSKWDYVIDPTKIMEVANRILRKNGKMLLFSQQPFTTELISKARPNLPFCYTIFWDKTHFANCLGAKKAMVNYVEECLLFNKTYDLEKAHPLIDYFINELALTGMSQGDINKLLGNNMGGHYFTNGFQFCIPTEANYIKLQTTRFFQKRYSDIKAIDEQFKSAFASTFNLWEGNKYKSNILKYKKDYTGYHPTQKPILLLEDLIKTFSNENDLVVDLTIGSGSTGVACINTGRNYIGIEKEEKYCRIAEERIHALKRPAQNTVEICHTAPNTGSPKCAQCGNGSVVVSCRLGGLLDSPFCQKYRTLRAGA
jgi:site-specific DNA-methyltransferase (adenine-specific)